MQGPIACARLHSRQAGLTLTRTLACRTLGTNPERNLSALWGILAAHILTLSWDAALDDLMKLRDIIDTNTFTPVLVQLQQRTWLMHWALFVFFNHENGRNAIIDLFLSDRQASPLPAQPLTGDGAPTPDLRWHVASVHAGRRAVQTESLLGPAAGAGQCDAQPAG